MTPGWREPPRVEAHRLMRVEPAALLPTNAPQRPALPSRTVEEIFHAGLLTEVILGPADEINTRIDSFFDGFRGLPLFDPPIDLPTWGAFGVEANQRRSTGEAFLGQSLQTARELLATAPGRFLIRSLPFENRERRNDTHELLYFRDSGIHRRLLERTVIVDRRARQRGGGAGAEDLRVRRLESYVPKRWEAFVITTIIDLVGERCDAFAYRHEETREIDLVLEWRDKAPPERWAIEVASRKFNTHPARYFADECEHLGVEENNRYLVRRADHCDGAALGRGGVPAISLPRIVEILRRRLRH